jgi:hypothetical protein
VSCVDLEITPADNTTSEWDFSYVILYVLLQKFLEQNIYLNCERRNIKVVAGQHCFVDNIIYEKKLFCWQRTALKWLILYVFLANIGFKPSGRSMGLIKLSSSHFIKRDMCVPHMHFYIALWVLNTHVPHAHAFYDRIILWQLCCLFVGRWGVDGSAWLLFCVWAMGDGVICSALSRWRMSLVNIQTWTFPMIGTAARRSISIHATLQES